MKTNKIIFWITTGLVSTLMLFSSGMYFFNYEEVAQVFIKLGFPTFIIYPLGAAKILGVATIVSRKNKTLAEWAYAGFVFNLLLAMGAHIGVDDGEFPAALVAFVLIVVSYIFSKKLETK